LNIYMKRVFISSDFPDFPRYLSFLKALVDVDDIPLNVSRETLQKTKVIQNITKSVINKSIGAMNKMSQQNETLYNEFYSVYANNLKLGVISETEEPRKNELASLLRFQSSRTTGKEMTSFASYIERMKTNQTDIYFVSGTDVPTLKKLPYVESLLKRDYEVLFMVDTYDEYTIQALPKYQEKTLKNVAKGGIKFDDEDETEKASLTEKYTPLTTYLSQLFSKKIEKVIVSSLLDKSPMAIVANTFGWSPAMEKLMGSNSGSGGPNDMMSAFFAKQKKIMEINPNHPLMQGLLQKIISLQPAVEEVKESTEETKDAKKKPAVPMIVNKELASDMKILFDAALIHSGYELKSPAIFAQRVEDMIRAKYGVEKLSEEAFEAEEKIAEAQESAGGMDDMFGAGGMPDFNMDGMGDFNMDGMDSMGEEKEASAKESTQETEHNEL